MLSFDDIVLLNADQICQPILSSDLDTLWHQVEQHYSDSTIRWTAFCNALCLKTFLDWLAEDPSFSALLPEETRLNQVVTVLATGHRASNQSYQKVQKQQFVSYLLDQPRQSAATHQTAFNGVLLSLQGTRLALIPCEAIDPDELSIPQAWVDIPELAADYYLAIALNLDEQWLRVYGYASYNQLKQKAAYNSRLKLYSLSQEDFHSRSLPWFTAYLTALLSTEPDTQVAPEYEGFPLPNQWTEFIQKWQAFGSKIWQSVYAFPTLREPTMALARGGDITYLIVGDYIVALSILQEVMEDPISDEIVLSIAASVTQGSLPLPANLQICLEFHDETDSSDRLEVEILADTKVPVVEFPQLLGVPGAEFSITATLADVKTTKQFVL